MKQKNIPTCRPDQVDGLSRRDFMKVGGAVAAAGVVGTQVAHAQEEDAPPPPAPKMQLRKLGRCGFMASDVSMGAGPLSDGNVARYAYDHGVNYFDTAETYGNGASETAIGEAMQFMDREKIFITTKMGPGGTVEDYLERYRKQLERMRTDYADCLMMHGIADVTIVDEPAYHAAADQLKQEGRLKHLGISSHGPRGDEPDSMEAVLVKAAEDGRFDNMLLVYSFLNKEEPERILAACKKADIGTTCMKMTPGVIEVPVFDKENPSEIFSGYIARMDEQGQDRETTYARIYGWLEEQEANVENTKPFAEKWGLKTEDELWAKSAQWVLQNPDMHTICLAMPDFETIDRAIALTGTTKLSRVDRRFLRDYEQLNGSRYCRHACRECAGACPENLSVSTIMRYSYYFKRQGREKYAMGKYAALQGHDASVCLGCTAPCTGACPHGVNIQANLVGAHSLLSFA